MRFWLFSHLENSPGNALIKKLATRRGHQVEEIHPDSLSLLIGAQHKDAPDLVYTRSGSSAPASALACLSLLEKSGYRCFNSAQSLHLCRDKGLTYALLDSAGVPYPRTLLLGSDLKGIEQIPGPPWILKLAVSTKGQGVCLVESERSLRSVADALRATGQSLLLQEFIHTARGADTRVIVLGGHARIAVCRRAADTDEFRSNLYLGGHSERVELSDDIIKIAESAASALGLDIAGVDLLQTESGYLVVEVNGSPGLTAAPELPGLVMDYLEEQAQ